MKLNSYQEVLDAVENGTLISFEDDHWRSFYYFMINKIDTSFNTEWSKLDPRFVGYQNSSEKNKVFKEQLKYVEQVHFDEFLKPLSNLRQHLLWCFDFDKSLTSFQDIMDAVKNQAVICPDPVFWGSFCSFINEQVPIAFLDSTIGPTAIGPFVWSTWSLTNDFEKNERFKKQLNYLAAEEKQDLVTIFFGRSTPKFPLERAKDREIWYVNEHPHKDLDPFELDPDTEMLEAETLTEEKVKKAAKVFDLVIREARKKDENYGVFEFQKDLESVAENEKIKEKTLKTFEEKKLLEIYGLFNEQYIFPRGLDLFDFSDSVYETWLEDD